MNYYYLLIFLLEIFYNVLSTWFLSEHSWINNMFINIFNLNTNLNSYYVLLIIKMLHAKFI